MLTAMQWFKCVSAFSLMLVILISIAIFLAYIKKKFYDYEELSERILNVLYTKLAILNSISAMLIFVEIVLRDSGMVLNEGLRIFVQMRVFFAFITVMTFLEISICSLLRLYSSQLYLWASSNLPPRYITFVQALMLSIFLLGNKPRIAKAKTVPELAKVMKDTTLPFASFMIVSIISFQLIFWLR